MNGYMLFMALHSLKICHLSNVIGINVHISFKNALLFSDGVCLDHFSMVTYVIFIKYSGSESSMFRTKLFARPWCVEGPQH